MAHSLIIGGTKGLGRVVARQLAKRGDFVSVFGRSDIPESDASVGSIDSYKVDVNDQLSVLAGVEKITEKYGCINYCVFSQRFRGQGDDWHGELQTTLTATKSVVEAIVPHMNSEGDNALVMVSSIFARYVGEGQAASYHVAKAGLDQLLRFYALELGPKGIRCNGITPFTFLKEESKNFYLNNKEILDLYESITPIKRMGTTEDSANTIEFLCSPSASFLTGQNILVDGGLSLVWPETLARKLLGI